MKSNTIISTESPSAAQRKRAIHTLGGRLKLVRESYNLSMEEFGRHVGVTRSHMSRLEDDGATASPELLERICQVFHVTPDWLARAEGAVFTSQDLIVMAGYGTPLPILPPDVPAPYADELISVLSLTIRNHTAEDLADLMADLARKPIYAPDLNRRINGLIAEELKKKLAAK